MQSNDEKKSMPIPEGGLLQSREWAAVARAEGKTVRSIGGMHALDMPLPLIGTYVYFPRAYDLSDFDITDVKNSSYAWVRIDVKDQEDLRSIHASDKKIVPAPHDMQPKSNLIMSLVPAEEEILSQMKGKTRYNIRLAEKKGVKIIASKEKKYINAFVDLVKLTADRKGVNFHSREHYEMILDVLPDEMTELYTAVYNDKIIGVNLVSFYNGTATYLHGATADEHRNVMAPYLLQWHAMRDAKEKGNVWYDLGGVFPDSDDLGKIGITRFKRGFAPQQEIFETLGSFDIILSPIRYRIYNLLQKMRTAFHL